MQFADRPIANNFGRVWYYFTSLCYALIFGLPAILIVGLLWTITCMWACEPPRDAAGNRQMNSTIFLTMTSIVASVLVTTVIFLILAPFAVPLFLLLCITFPCRSVARSRALAAAIEQSRLTAQAAAFAAATATATATLAISAASSSNSGGRNGSGGGVGETNAAADNTDNHNIGGSNSDATEVVIEMNNNNSGVMCIETDIENSNCQRVVQEESDNGTENLIINIPTTATATLTTTATM